MTQDAFKQAFDQAVEFVTTQEANFNPSKSLKLRVYALYKQATEGDVQGKKPSLIDLVAREKYKAWSAIKGMTAEEAMQTYIDEVNNIR